MRKQRLAAAEPVSPAAESRAKAHGRAVLRIHESLDIVSARGSLRVACRCCDQDLGPADRNYKLSCIHAAIDKDALTELPPPGGRRSMARYVEYYCPGCATLLDVETHCPSVEGERIEPVWDIAPAASALKKAIAESKEKKAA
jgi:acetone carboxylase gamma subunit